MKKIIHKYKDTMQQARKSTSGQDHPITCEELAEIARKAFSQSAKLIDYDFKPFSQKLRGYLGNYQQLSLRVRSREDEGAREMTFFVKSTRDAYDRKFSEKEVNFFLKLSPLLLRGYKNESWAPKCFLAKSDVLVLEDLSASFFDTHSDWDYDRCASAASTIARFHASSTLAEHRLKKPLAELFPGEFSEGALVASDWLTAGMLAGESVARHLGMKGGVVAEAYDLAVERDKYTGNIGKVVCHGDIWSNNLMFDVRKKSRLVDFQIVSYAPPVVDLLQLLYVGCTRDDRNRWGSALIARYRATLKETLEENDYRGEIVNEEEVLQSVEDGKVCGLVFAVQYLPITLMNETMKSEYCEDDDKLRHYMYTSRSEFVLRALEQDENFSRRVCDAVMELHDVMQRINKAPLTEKVRRFNTR